jgi:hypothetical protein
MQRIYRLIILVTVLTAPARDAASEVTRATLHEVSMKIVGLYNSTDAAELHAMLASNLRQTWAVEQLARRLADCRRRFGVLERISLPVMGTRTYGFIAAYFETSGRDMFLEIDRDGLIKVLTFRGQNDSCTLSQP